MLSPYEFAALMLIDKAPDQVDPDRAELDMLPECQRRALEEMASGVRRRCLTHDGNSVLEKIGSRIR